MISRRVYQAISFGGLLSLGIIAIFLTYELNQLQKYLPISSVDFAQINNYVKVNSAKIYGLGTTIVSPNDELSLDINMTNKQNSTLLIEPKVLLYVGGELRKIKDLSSATLSPYQNGVLLPSTFFAAEEGQNEIQLSLKISSHGNFLQYYNSSTSIQVLSTSEKLQEIQNQYLLWGVISASVIGAFTTGSLIVSTIMARKQVNELKIQNSKLEKQNEEFQTQANKRNELMDIEHKTNAMIKIFELLSSHDSRESRRIMYKEYCFLKKQNKPIIFDGTDFIKKEADKIKSSFDLVSVLVLNGLLDEELFFKIYGGMIIRSWKALEEDIKSDWISNPKNCENFKILKERFEKRFTPENMPEPYCREKVD